ncbi:MAG: hypothetical protein R2810_04175 [Flavobacteriales bacterium]
MLMKEYRDGILLFELTDERVWSKAVEDSAGLAAYYQDHQLDFMWDTRYDADLYTCADATVYLASFATNTGKGCVVRSRSMRSTPDRP